MEVSTYTNIWQTEKKLYSIYEWTLPAPVGFRQLGLFIAGVVVWAPIMLLFQVPLNSPLGLAAWLLVPVGLAIFGNKPIFEGKSMLQYAYSLIRYLTEPKVILDGQSTDPKVEKMPNAKTPQVPLIVEVDYWTREQTSCFERESELTHA